MGIQQVTPNALSANVTSMFETNFKQERLHLRVL